MQVITYDTIKEDFKNLKIEKNDNNFPNKDEYIKKLTNIYNSSTSVVKSKIIDEMVSQNGIDYLIKHLIIDNTKNKPILIGKKDFIDPFSLPLKDMVVDDNFCNFNIHRVLLTKFPLFAKQLLLVSREFVSQYTHLTFENMRDMVLLLDLIDGFGFFNGGIKSGASQPRKHLQAAPFSSIPNKQIGLFSYINKEENLKKIDLTFDNEKYYKPYSIKVLDDVQKENILFKFTTTVTEMFKDYSKCDSLAKIILLIYHIGLKYLNLYNNGNKIESDYTFLITEEFMFLTPRKEHDVYISEEDKEKGLIINLNSLAFFFIIVSRTEHQISEMKNGNIVKDVLSKL